MNLINIMTGLLTPLIAIIAAYIAYQQYYSNKKQGELKLELEAANSELENNRLKIEEYRLKLDLYEKRYNIFDKIKKLLLKINKDAEIDITELADFMAETNECKFLFDKDIESYRDETIKKALDITHLREELKDKTLFPVKSQNRNDKVKICSDLTTWFTFEYENIEARFKKYLNFKNL